jgi:cell division protein FtsW
MWLRERTASPTFTYHLILGVLVSLLCLGLVMVLSASSVTSYGATHSSFTVFFNQARFAGLGVVAAFVASRFTVRLWKRIARLSLIVTIVLELLVYSPLGVRIQGNRNWIHVAGQSIQPSEFIKVGLILFGAVTLAQQRRRLHLLKDALVPFVLPGATIPLVMVVGGHDLGTGLVMLGIVATMLWAAGVPARLFTLTGAGFAGGAAVMAITSPNRMRRIHTWLGGTCTDPTGTCWQSIHGQYALADGGWWGVGLGASREKWYWLPEAHNDFIFAIIGEELGVPGTLVVLVLFSALAYACYRLVTRLDDPFVRIASAGVMAWVVGQAIINVGSVIGLLPVIGVPLPLVSAGGSALVTTMFAFGMLLSFARTEPRCVDALEAGARTWVGRRLNRINRLDPSARSRGHERSASC